MEVVKEAWKNVEGYEDYLQVSNFGKVRSLDRVQINSLGRTYFYRGVTLKQQIDRYGYCYVACSRYGTPKKFKVHRLVAQALVKGINETVDHIDGDKLNNKDSNLRWMSAEANCSIAHKKGMYNYARGESSGNSYLTTDIVKFVRLLNKLGNTNKEIRDMIGLDIKMIGRLVRKDRWKHVGYI